MAASTLSPPAIALRFQRDQLAAHAGLSTRGRALLAEAAGPQALIDLLEGDGAYEDAMRALVQILPHRQTVWWACLAVRLLPGLDSEPMAVDAVRAAESWVQQGDPAAAGAALAAADACDPDHPGYWAAIAAYWSGPSLSPPALEAVRPAPHLPGVATRTALLLLLAEPGLHGRLDWPDLIGIGRDLMAGNLGRAPQSALLARLAIPVATTADEV